LNWAPPKAWLYDASRKTGFESVVRRYASHRFRRL
jgi:hypothetical protein